MASHSSPAKCRCPSCDVLAPSCELEYVLQRGYCWFCWERCVGQLVWVSWGYHCQRLRRVVADMQQLNAEFKQCTSHKKTA
jgi:hypothetical protein